MKVLILTLLFDACFVKVHGDYHKNEDAEVALDFHSGQHCSDISYYSKVQYRDNNTVCCNTAFVKKCEERTKEVCVDVTEVQCKAVAWADCKMQMKAKEGLVCEYTNKVLDVQKCTPYIDTVLHIKRFPECKNVTKLNCVTNWETDEDGNPVWTGNDKCTPVSWLECKLVEKEVPFNFTKTRCETVEQLPWTDCGNKTKEEMTTSMTCEVKSSINCIPRVREDCVTIKYQECEEVAEQKCDTKVIKTPFQHKFHQKKCLLPDDSNVFIDDSIDDTIELVSSASSQISRTTAETRRASTPPTNDILE